MRGMAPSTGTEGASGGVGGCAGRAGVGGLSMSGRFRIADEADLGQAGLRGVGQGLGDGAVGHALVGLQVDLRLGLLLAEFGEAARRLGALDRLSVPEAL